MSVIVQWRYENDEPSKRRADTFPSMASAKRWISTVTKVPPGEAKAIILHVSSYSAARDGAQFALGPPPSDPSKIKFDPHLFEKVGEETEYVVLLPAPRGPQKFATRAEAEAFAKRVGRTVEEWTSPVMRRKAWFRDGDDAMKYGAKWEPSEFGTGGFSSESGEFRIAVAPTLDASVWTWNVWRRDGSVMKNPAHGKENGEMKAKSAAESAARSLGAKFSAKSQEGKMRDPNPVRQYRAGVEPERKYAAGWESDGQSGLHAEVGKLSLIVVPSIAPGGMKNFRWRVAENIPGGRRTLGEGYALDESGAKSAAEAKAKSLGAKFSARVEAKYSGTFKDYDEAYRHAQQQASSSGLDVAIRKTKEYGKTVFNVAFASKSDSDYANAEIVTPSHPRTQHSAEKFLKHNVKTPSYSSYSWMPAGAGKSTRPAGRVNLFTKARSTGGYDWWVEDAGGAKLTRVGYADDESAAQYSAEAASKTFGAKF